MHRLDFYTSHSQFYICDKESPFRTDSDQFWTDKAFQDRLAVEDGIIGVGTECYGPVKAILTVRNYSNQSFDIEKYDHIVEASLHIKSGIFQIIACTSSDIELEIHLPLGNYRVRVYSLNLATVVGDKGNDFYEIEIWPSNPKQREVIKRYQSK